MTLDHVFLDQLLQQLALGAVGWFFGTGIKALRQRFRLLPQHACRCATSSCPAGGPQPEVRPDADDRRGRPLPVAGAPDGP